jgi:hypothetical protein
VRIHGCAGAARLYGERKPTLIPKVPARVFTKNAKELGRAGLAASLPVNVRRRK